MARPARWWLPAVLGLLVYLGLVGWLVWVQLRAPLGQRLVDLAVYRDAGRSVLDGRHVYDHLTAAPQRLAFTYPPLSAVLAVPLAWLPFSVVGVLWSAGELVLTPVITWFGVRRLLPRAGRWWPVALALLAGLAQQMLPFRDEVRFGQVDELVVVLCLLDCITRRPWWPRGVLVGLAAAVKLTPAVFVPYLWLTGRRRAAVTAAGAFAGLELLAAAVVPHDAAAYWSRDLFHTGRLQPNNGTSNQSLRGLLLRTSLPKPAEIAVLVAVLAVVAVVGFRRAAAASAGGDEAAGVALTGMLAVLLSPVAWIHHLVWLPLVVGVLIDDGRSARRVAAAVATYLFFVVRIPWIGHHLVVTGAPTVLARTVEDGFGLAAAVVVLVLPFRDFVNKGTETPVASGSRSRHHSQEQGRAHAPARTWPTPGSSVRGGP